MTMILKLFNKKMKQNDKARQIPPAVPCDYIQSKFGQYPPDLKYPPKEPKRDKFDYIMLIMIIILASLFIIIIPCEIFYKQNKIQKEAITIDCKLLNRDFKSPSGFRSKFIVNFDCGNYGILISDDKEIFRQAKENNKLTVYFGYNDYKILGI